MCVVANGVKSWLMCYSLDIDCAHVILNLLHEMASGVMAELQRCTLLNIKGCCLLRNTNDPLESSQKHYLTIQ
jgi:hypothetical protein